MKLVLVLGRVAFSAVFLIGGLRALSADAVFEAAARGLPAAFALVPLAGLVAIWGAVSTALGWRARWGAFLLIVFLAPGTVVMHRFWGLHDARAAAEQQVQFLKNISLMGGALMILYFGPGPWSVDGRRERRRLAHLHPARPSELSRNLSLTLLGAGRVHGRRSWSVVRPLGRAQAKDDG